MAKGYWIAFYRSVSNPDAMAAYAKLAGPAIAAAGGRFSRAATPRKHTRPGRPARGRDRVRQRGESGGRA